MGIFTKNDPSAVRIGFTYDLTALRGLTEFLEEKAAEGLMLRKKSGSDFIFDRAEEKKLRYCAVVRPRIDGMWKDNVKGYIAFCTEAGWEHVLSDGDVLIFRTENEDVPEIETDPREIFRAVKRSSIFESVACLLIGLGAALLCLLNARLPEGGIKNPVTTIAVCAIWVLIGVFMFLGLRHNESRWLKEARREAKAGRPIPFRGKDGTNRRPNAYFWIALVLLLLFVVIGGWGLLAERGALTSLEQLLNR